MRSPLLEVPAGRGTAVVPRGSGPLSAVRGGDLIAHLATEPRPVVVDAGTVTRDRFGRSGLAEALVEAASRSLLVVARLSAGAAAARSTLPSPPAG